MQKKILQKLGQIIYTAAILVVILFGLFMLSTALPLPRNFEIKIVQSGSMEPAIRTGAAIFVRQFEDYQVGQVVTFGEDSIDAVPTTHRIVDTQIVDGSLVYITQGDANDDVDPYPVRPSEIIGRVVFDVSWLGYVLDFARTKFGFILLIGGPLAILALDEVRKIIREVQHMSQKEHDEK